jgi:hypothetical protein
MTGILPTPQEAQELRELRGLRVTRARERHAVACREVSAAELAVRQRQQAIEAGKAAIATLAGAVVTSLAPHLPRWHGVLHAQQARLAERLERDEDALIGESRRLDETQAAAQQTRLAVSRALAREDVAQDLAKQARQARSAAAERRAEVELEDQRPVAPTVTAPTVTALTAATSPVAASC